MCQLMSYLWQCQVFEVLDEINNKTNVDKMKWEPSLEKTKNDLPNNITCHPK